MIRERASRLRYLCGLMAGSRSSGGREDKAPGRPVGVSGLGRRTAEPVRVARGPWKWRGTAVCVERAVSDPLHD